MREVVIIGSGPAGLTAAIYTARAGMKPLVLEGLQPGGQLTITTDIENYPGFPEGVAGPELMDQMRVQAERFGSEHVYSQVEKVDFSQRPLRVWYDDEVVEAKTIIIATGATATLLGLEKESELMGRGVSACATCDGFFFQGRQVAVVGGGDTAMEEASFLTRFADKVTVIHRRDELRASRIMRERAFKNPKIEFIWDSVVAGLNEDAEGMLGSITLRNVKTGELTDFPIDGLFYGIGHTPATMFLGGQIELQPDGYIQLNDHTHTSVEAVFAAGDVADSRYRQAVSAAGMGCQAALDVEKYLESLED